MNIRILYFCKVVDLDGSGIVSSTKGRLLLFISLRVGSTVDAQVKTNCFSMTCVSYLSCDTAIE
ncbi:hypothetical protein C0J52_01336 [Blattella germanica]|nr:hypothetical protein C0J52_01336 [Blattella germanica]